MNEEKKKIMITANKKVVTFSLIALALIMLVSTSYAYFTAVISGNDSAKQTSVTTGTMSVELINTEEINLDGMMPGESKEVHFSVKNTGTATTTYGVGLLVDTNNFGDKSDLVYTIVSDNNGGNKTESILPSESTTPSTLISVVLIEPNVTQNYTMTIKFKETNDNQNDNQGKTFVGKVQLVDVNRNLLANRILIDNRLKTTTPDFSIAEPPYDSSLTNTGSGLYAAEDDYGTSYYYRGNIENNHVSFADIEWRIVRVNGDGTIRLIVENDFRGTSQTFNTTNNEHKYVGYTYDNDHACTKSSPCTSNTGTSSTIKDYLENEWYISNLASYEDKIALGSYCNDTTSRLDGTTKYYKSYDNLQNGTPSLDCEDTSETYGGYYKLKVGLLTADEIMMAGFGLNSSTYDANYLYLEWVFWSLSPGSSTTSSSSIFAAPYGAFSNTEFGDTVAFGVSPVINLKADTLITAGDGTESSPYVIE